MSIYGLVRMRMPVFVLIALAAIVAIWSEADRTSAADANVSVGSATVPLGGSVTVTLTVQPQPGVVVGALDVLIGYDNSYITASGCLASAIGTCNVLSADPSVTFSFASPSGISGPVGTIDFQAGTTSGYSNLYVVVTVCADGNGNSLASCQGSGGEITVGATPAPSPTPSGAVTASPTPSLQTDLSVASRDIWVVPQAPNQGDYLELRAIIKNNSGLQASVVQVVFYDQDGALPAVLNPVTVDVPANGVAIASTNWNATGKYGHRNLTVKIDPNHYKPDPNRSNNDATADILLMTKFGDVNCNSEITSVDALDILRWTAGLSYSHPAACPLVGSP